MRRLEYRYTTNFKVGGGSIAAYPDAFITSGGSVSAYNCARQILGDTTCFSIQASTSRLQRTTCFNADGIPRSFCRADEVEAPRG